MTLEGIQKIIKGMAAKVDSDLEPPVLVEPVPKVVKDPEPKLEVKDPESKVVAELVPLSTEVEELPIKILVDVPTKPTVELFTSYDVFLIILEIA